jgi:hypothetical protein
VAPEIIEAESYPPSRAASLAFVVVVEGKNVE